MLDHADCTASTQGNRSYKIMQIKNPSDLKDLDHQVGIDHTDHTDHTDHLADVWKGSVGLRVPQVPVRHPANGRAFPGKVSQGGGVWFLPKKRCLRIRRIELRAKPWKGFMLPPHHMRFMRWKTSRFTSFQIKINAWQSMKYIMHTDRGCFVLTFPTDGRMDQLNKIMLWLTNNGNKMNQNLPRCQY